MYTYLCVLEFEDVKHSKGPETGRHVYIKYLHQETDACTGDVTTKLITWLPHLDKYVHALIVLY